MLRLFGIIAILVLIAASSSAQSDSPKRNNQPSDKQIAAWANQARLSLFQQDYASALQAAKKLTNADDERLHLLAGDTLLRCGDSKSAVVQFEKHLERSPEDRAHLWQLGIAYYFENQFKQGAKLFEIHRTVNPNDVENAAWHFLCVAKFQSAEKAKELLLPAPGDARPPMEQVLEMLHTGETATVQSTMNSFAAGSSAERSAKFYGHFYLGLYADALGDLNTARKHIDTAAKDPPKHYMGDVARVYSKYLEQQTKSSADAKSPTAADSQTQR